MRYIPPSYSALLIGLIMVWWFVSYDNLGALWRSLSATYLALVVLLYLCSHAFRLLRLGILTLDKRRITYPLLIAHSLTAFPSSFMPFKAGEILRLAAFSWATGWQRTVLSVWLVERFSDMVAITILILSLSFMGLNVPKTIQSLLIVFVILSTLGVLGLIAVARLSIYLNRHLVLSSNSEKGLRILKANHIMRVLERDIINTIEGRVSSLIMLTSLIWLCELTAIGLFIDTLSLHQPNIAELFSSGLLASLPGINVENKNLFGLYQSSALIILTLSTLFIVYFRSKRRN